MAGGNGIATVYDNMVHYNTERSAAQIPPPTCPKCGSHRTQIIGRLEDGRTLILRCNVCGAHSTILSTRPFAECLSWEDLKSA
jgi:hypothetical protein